MKKNLGIVLISLVLLTACSFAEGKLGPQIKQVRAEHRVTQRAENVAFRETLKGKTAEERAALKATHRATQQSENQALKKQMEEKKLQWKAQKAQRKALKSTTAPTSETVTQ